MKERISPWLKLLFDYWIGPLLGHSRPRSMFLTLVYFGLAPSIPHCSPFPSLLVFPCRLIPPPFSSFASSMHLSSSIILPTVWPPPRSSLHPVASDLMASRPGVTGIYPSHVLLSVYLCPPLLIASRMPFQNLSSASSSSQEIQHFLG